MAETNAEQLKRYSFRVRWSDEDGKWMGQCPAFPDLFCLTDEMETAFAELKRSVVARLNTLQVAPEEGSVFKGMDDMLSGAPGPFGKMG